MQIFIPIDPMGAPRPRVTRFGAYNDKKYTEYKKAIGIVANKFTMSDSQISIKIDFFFEYPKSWSKKKKESTKWHTSKPDIDNLCKGVLDALNGVAYKDDAQVCFVCAQKQYAIHSGILIEVSKMENR